MKIITVLDNFGNEHFVCIHAITEFIPNIPNYPGAGAIELNNGHRIIISNKLMRDIVNLINNDNNEPKKEKKNG